MGARARLCAEVVRAHRGEPLPPVRELDGVLLLGSHASPREEGPALVPVRTWVAEALARDVPVLATGTGAQLVACVLGAEVAVGALHEAGPIALVSEDPSLAAGPWVAWRRDFVVLPPGLQVTGFNGHGVQAFTVGPHSGLLFHPEATPPMVEAWAAGPSAVRAPAGVVADVRRVAPAAATAARVLFDGWAAGAGLAAAGEAVAVPS